MVCVCGGGGLILKVFYSKIYYNKIAFFHFPGKYFCNYSISNFLQLLWFLFFFGGGGGVGVVKEASFDLRALFRKRIVAEAGGSLCYYEHAESRINTWI